MSSCGSGRKNVVCFKNMANWIISNKWYEGRELNAENEAERIIKMAVKIIKNDLRTFVRTTNADTYPSTDDIQNCKWIPNTLRLLLSSLIQSELKVESIGQCIMKAEMSRSALVPPILFGLGVEVDHKCGSPMGPRTSSSSRKFRSVKYTLGHFSSKGYLSII